MCDGESMHMHAHASIKIIVHPWKKYLCLEDDIVKCPWCSRPTYSWFKGRSNIWGDTVSEHKPPCGMHIGLKQKLCCVDKRGKE